MKRNARINSLLAVAMLICHTGLAQKTEVLNIGLFRDARPEKAIVRAAAGEYDVYGDGGKLMVLDESNLLQLSIDNGNVKAEVLSGTLGVFGQIRLLRKDWGSAFSVKSVAPVKRESEFSGNLTVTVNGPFLQLVNDVYIEHYIAGVVESESGIYQKEEYYKAQAVICRTYALAHLTRHLAEGFQLCDQVHCQAYKSRSKGNPVIYRAANSTKDYVLVDSDINLITASFHSNCGGQTVNSEDVWRYPMNYLRSVKDSFCLRQPHATWEKQIPTQEWLDYLKGKYNYPVEDSLYYHTAVHYSPPKRETHFTPLDSTIVLKDLRQDWQLSSTYFSISRHNGSLNFKGHGYGHGVGLCQEGAMEMANQGHEFTRILHYYYTDVHLIDLAYLNFFRE